MSILFKSPKAGNKYFLRKLSTEFKRIFKQIIDKTKRLQGRMYTLENYRRDQESCPIS